MVTLEFDGIAGQTEASEILFVTGYGWSTLGKALGAADGSGEVADGVTLAPLR